MVANLFSLLSTRQNTILSGATVLMLAVSGSKILGLVRDRLLADTFETKTLDIIFAAFSLPDLIFQLLIFGALSVAFIPVFTDYLNHKGEKEAFYFAANTLNISLLLFLIAASLSFIFVSPLNSILLPGFSGEQKSAADELTRIILFGQVMLLLGTLFIGISQSFQRFIFSALAPVVYNLGWIFGIIFLSPQYGIKGAAYGVVLGAFLHMLIQLPLIYSLGFRFRLSLDFYNSGVKEIIKLMSFRNIGLVFEQIGDRIAIALASLITYPSITLLTFSQHLFILPISLFGQTIASAALPVLSREYSRGEKESFKITLLTTMHQILFLTLPAAAILIVLRIPVVRLVFGADKFNWADTVLTGRTVAFFAVGLAAQAAILLLIRGFYALKDTKTPAIVSILSVAIYIWLGFLLIRVFAFDVWGLGLSYAVSTNISFVLLLYFLGQKVGGFPQDSLILPALKMLLAAVVAAIALYIPIKALDQLVFDTTRTINLLILTGIASFFGLSVYLILVWVMKVKELSTFINLLKRVTRPKSVLNSKEITEDTGTI